MKPERTVRMSEKTKKNIRLIYGIALSVLLIVTGILLMISCVSIYKLGARSFTVENISAEFDKICIPVYITLAAVVIGIVMQILIPEKKGKIKANADSKAAISRLEKRLDTSLCDKTALSLISKEKTLRVIMKIALAVVCIAAATTALVYVLNPESFMLENYNECVIAACLWVLPCSFISIGVFIAYLYAERASYSRQLEHLKVAIASGAKKATENASEDDRSEKKWQVGLVWGVRAAILIVAVFFIIEGISNGGMSDVLIKAINICTECIGLG